MRIVFTGIVEGMGEVRGVAPEPGGVRLTLALPPAIGRLAAGGSLAVDGACLTVVEAGPGQVACQAIAETLRRTTLGRLRPGARVNLERPLEVGGRLEGHWVQGHVDGRARVVERAPEGESVRFGLELLDPALSRYVVAKGSIAIDGVSLTVGEIHGARFTVYLIPHTLAVTTLGERRPADEVNVEVDILAKYLEHLIGRGAPAAAGVDLEAFLRAPAGPGDAAGKG